MRVTHTNEIMIMPIDLNGKEAQLVASDFGFYVTHAQKQYALVKMNKTDYALCDLSDESGLAFTYKKEGSKFKPYAHGDLQFDFDMVTEEFKSESVGHVNEVLAKLGQKPAKSCFYQEARQPYCLTVFPARKAQPCLKFLREAQFQKLEQKIRFILSVVSEIQSWHKKDLIHGDIHLKNMSYDLKTHQIFLTHYHGSLSCDAKYNKNSLPFLPNICTSKYAYGTRDKSNDIYQLVEVIANIFGASCLGDKQKFLENLFKGDREKDRVDSKDEVEFVSIQNFDFSTLSCAIEEINLEYQQKLLHLLKSMEGSLGHDSRPTIDTVKEFFVGFLNTLTPTKNRQEKRTHSVSSLPGIFKLSRQGSQSSDRVRKSLVFGSDQ